jgi:hypothetical protein
MNKSEINPQNSSLNFTSGTRANCVDCQNLLPSMSKF